MKYEFHIMVEIIMMAKKYDGKMGLEPSGVY